MRSPALTHTQPHIYICLDTESQVGSATGICSQLICNTDHSVRKKENHVKASICCNQATLLLTVFILLHKNSEL